ncbi:uncharacterized protein qrfp [Acanthochromis polyacanthus]|uniref:uncharacterized protein qrfp n=1 Tax=Acanthochromis polyacanthus TaxID=80966 RepID=UPI0022341F37|nr:uncharacterized protein qrfp [Acanthochromis polyacanthus]
MRLSFHLGVSLLSLALILPWSVTSHPVSPTALLPTMDRPKLQSALLDLQAALAEQRYNWSEWDQDPWPEEEALLRTQREEGDGENDWKRNEALTSIAGGLQAVSREKGGFGFRFGRKRWTDRGWRDEGMEGGEGRTQGGDEREG